MPQALRLLGAALHERGLMIHDFPADTDARLALIRGLMALLPAHARPDLTFSTNRHEKTMTQARDRLRAEQRRHRALDRQLGDEDLPRRRSAGIALHPRLLALWKGDLGRFPERD